MSWTIWDRTGCGRNGWRAINVRGVRVRRMRYEVVGVRMEDDRWRLRWRVVHTNVAFLLTREMPVGHGRGGGMERW
jgi:hypothetical protein